MTESTSPTHPTADRFFAAVERSDWGTVRELSASGAVFAQHVGPGTGTQRDVDGLIELLSGTTKQFGAFDYRGIRRQLSPAGFAQLHTLTFADRPEMQVLAMVMAWLDETNRITRVDEFIDPNPFNR